jgi:hypothetical protein
VDRLPKCLQIALTGITRLMNLIRRTIFNSRPLPRFVFSFLIQSFSLKRLIARDVEQVAAAAKAALEAGATNNSANNSNVVASTEQPIRFATLHKLVGTSHCIVHFLAITIIERGCNRFAERVCHEKHQDMTLRYVFLLTYRSFCTPQELFSALRSRFYVPLPPNMSGPELDMFKKSVLAPIQIKVLAVLKNWVEEHWLADFAFQAPADAIAAEKAALEAGIGLFVSHRLIVSCVDIVMLYQARLKRFPRLSRRHCNALSKRLVCWPIPKRC